jgi:ornithine cyclodeaminase/alanine dehydrogenase-like protein (mu-crystallin family)
LAISPTYIAKIPVDPSTGSPENTGYTIYEDSKTGRIVASASGELISAITVDR